MEEKLQAESVSLNMLDNDPFTYPSFIVIIFLLRP